MLMENPVIRFLNKMTDLFVLNLLFLICCIPIVTIGPALTAMHYVNLKSVRYGDGYVVKRFFQAFRQNFLQSAIAGGVMLFLGIIFWMDISFWLRSGSGMFSSVMLMVSACFAFIVAIVAMWIFPIIAKTENTLLQHIKNAAAMAVGHFFPYTIICIGLQAVAAYLMSTNLVADLLMLLIGFAFVSYIQAFFFYKVFAKYLKEEAMGEDDPLYGNVAEKN